MDVSVIIPAYNESGRIGDTLEQIRACFAESGWSWELVVVDDGSDDGTAQAVEDWQSANPGRAGEISLSVITIPHQGKGAAVAAGVMAASGRFILMTDADLSTPITEWPKLAEALQNGARVAAGSRQAPGAMIETPQQWLRQRLGLLFGRVVRRLFPLGVYDSQCGFKAFEAKAARELFSGLQARGYCFDVEIIMRARARGFTVAEIPVRWKNHPDSKVRVWRDWPAIIAELWAIRREMKNRRDGGGERE